MQYDVIKNTSTVYATSGGERREYQSNEVTTIITEAMTVKPYCRRSRCIPVYCKIGRIYRNCNAYDVYLIDFD